jgi:hypothetical protein
MGTVAESFSFLQWKVTRTSKRRRFFEDYQRLPMMVIINQPSRAISKMARFTEFITNIINRDVSMMVTLW